MKIKLMKLINAYMLKYNLTQTQFANKMKMSQSSICKYMNNRATPTYATLQKFRKYSKCEINLIG